GKITCTNSSGEENTHDTDDDKEKNNIPNDIICNTGCSLDRSFLPPIFYFIGYIIKVHVCYLLNSTTYYIIHFRIFAVDFVIFLGKLYSYDLLFIYIYF